MNIFFIGHHVDSHSIHYWMGHECELTWYLIKNMFTYHYFFRYLINWLYFFNSELCIIIFETYSLLIMQCHHFFKDQKWNWWRTIIFGPLSTAQRFNSTNIWSAKKLKWYDMKFDTITTLPGFWLRDIITCAAKCRDTKWDVDGIIDNVTHTHTWID